jgi:hypothetical protein
LFTCQAESPASPAEAWELLARPDRWHEWAPHVRGAWGLGEPEVEEGRRGYARLLGVLPVPARITEVREGSSWSWQVGPARMAHRVEEAGGGCLVAVDIEAPAPLEAALRALYGPLVDLLLARLAEKAASRAQ